MMTERMRVQTEKVTKEIKTVAATFMLFLNYESKTISVKEMEPNFIRIKVPGVIKHLQVLTVLQISVAKTNFLDLSVKADELAITSMSEAVKSSWTAAST